MWKKYKTKLLYYLCFCHQVYKLIMIGWVYLVANHSLSESQPLKFRQVIVSAKCLLGEKSVRQSVRFATKRVKS